MATPVKVRKGDWKVIEQFESQAYEIYNPADDPNARPARGREQRGKEKP